MGHDHIYLGLTKKIPKSRSTSCFLPRSRGAGPPRPPTAATRRTRAAKAVKEGQPQPPPPQGRNLRRRAPGSYWFVGGVYCTSQHVRTSGRLVSGGERKGFRAEQQIDLSSERKINWILDKGLHGKVYDAFARVMFHTKLRSRETSLTVHQPFQIATNHAKMHIYSR